MGQGAEKRERASGSLSSLSGLVRRYTLAGQTNKCSGNAGERLACHALLGEGPEVPAAPTGPGAACIREAGGGARAGAGGGAQRRFGCFVLRTPLSCCARVVFVLRRPFVELRTVAFV